MSTRCLNCGRPLSVNKSIERGFGPKCFEQINGVDPQINAPPAKIRPKKWSPKDISINTPSRSGSYLLYRDLAGYALVEFHEVGYSPVNIRHIIHHSQSGMEFGYLGSGSSDCARSILTDCVGLPIADTLYHDFKAQFIANLDEDAFNKISIESVHSWVKTQLEKEQNK